jgi:hypothetical protein
MNARQAINATIKAKTHPIESEIKGTKAKIKLLISKIEAFNKNQTPEQSKKCNKIMTRYYNAIDGATKAFELTKLQIMASHMEEQVKVYEND